MRDPRDRCGAVHPRRLAVRCGLDAGHLGDHELHGSAFSNPIRWPQSYNGPSPLDDATPAPGEREDDR